MSNQLIHANVVLVARQFNPSIFSQLWLVNNGIATEDDLKGESVFTPAFVQLRTPRYVLLVLPEQLQLAPIMVDEKDTGTALVTEKVGKIVELLPQTPYVAVGLNFTWQLLPDAQNFPDYCRALFWRTNPLFSFFDAENARFGGYLSKDFMGLRLKLDVKPVKAVENVSVDERLLFAFNYHVDIGTSTPVGQIKHALNLWDQARTHSNEIVSSLETWKWK